MPTKEQRLRWILVDLIDDTYLIARNSIALRVARDCLEKQFGMEPAIQDPALARLIAAALVRIDETPDTGG